MGQKLTKSIATLGAALLVVGILGGCGGGSATTTASTLSPTTRVGGEKERGHVETGPLKIVGGGPASYRATGHYINVPRFGEEASKADLRRAATAEHDYLVARVESDWTETCSSVSKSLMRSLTTRSRKFMGKGCPEILGAITVPTPGGSAYESSEVEAESLRINGTRAFLLYRAATAPYFMPMLIEGGVWKVTALAPTPFY